MVQAKERSKQELSQRRSQLAACTAQLGVHSGYLVEYERQLVEVSTFSALFFGVDSPFNRAGMLGTDF